MLGTLVVPRSRSISTSQGPKTSPPTDHKEQKEHPSLSRSFSEKTPGPKPRRVSATSSLNNSKDGTAEEFFIDMILARHARKLLQAGRLADLGKFAAHLDFHLVAWLRREATRAGQIQDFGWPFPTTMAVGSGSDSSRPRSSSHQSCLQLDDKLRTLYIDVGDKPGKRDDSGYGNGVSTSTAGRQVQNTATIAADA